MDHRRAELSISGRRPALGQHPHRNLSPDYDPSLVSRHIAFVDNKVGFSSLPGDGLFRTLDGGASWSKIGSAKFGRLYFKNAAFGIATREGVFRTVNGGQSWTTIPLSRPEDICYSDTRIYGAVGSRLVLSEDQGLSWTTVRELPESINRLSPCENGIWLVGYNGMVAQYLPGTNELKVRTLPGDPTLFDIAFCGGTGVVVGTSGRIYVSADHFQTWREKKVGKEDFVSVAFSPGGTVYIVGGTQTPLYWGSPFRSAWRSADFDNWERVNLP